MRDCWCSFEFDLENGYYVWIENVKRGTLELIYIMIVDSRDCDFEDVISRLVVDEI